jgi:Vesicle transport v-SNARE protein N-terminus
MESVKERLEAAGTGGTWTFGGRMLGVCHPAAFCDTQVHFLMATCHRATQSCNAESREGAGRSRRDGEVMCLNRLLRGSLSHFSQQISQMELEIRGMPQSIRPRYAGRVKTSKTELNRWKATSVSSILEHCYTYIHIHALLSCRKKSIKLLPATHSSPEVVRVWQPRTSIPLTTHTEHRTGLVSSLEHNLLKSQRAGWKTPNEWLWRPRTLAQTSCEA